MPSIEELQTMLERDPTDTFVLYAMGQEHAKQGDHQAAVDFYRRCLGQNPQECYAYFHEAKSLEALGRTDEAQERLREGVRAAREAGDEKALGELGQYLDELS
jgi:tetratricopeptide (TPR) repeat protein